MGGFHGGFFIWDELEKVCGRKLGENAKIQHFWAKTRRQYRYQRVVPVPLKLVSVPTGSEELVPVPVKVVPVPLLPATLIWHIFAPLSPVFVHDCLGTLRND